MANDDDVYKREEDRRWRQKVDHQQVTMMTAINVLQDGVREIRSRLREIDITLRGEKGRGGLVAEYERQDGFLTRLNAVIFQDATGRKGLLGDIDKLMGRGIEDDRLSQRRWSLAEKALAGTIAGIFALAVAAVTHLDAVIPELQRIETHFGRQPPAKKQSAKVKRPKRRARLSEEDEPEAGGLGAE